MKYYIKTFGCQMNYSDSERIASFLETQKMKPVKNINEADLVVFNTCGVRQMAEDRVYGQIHNLRRNNPKIKIVLTGCLAHRKDVQKRLKNKVDLFIGINELEKIKEIINSRSIDEINDYLSIKPKYISKHTAYIPIMTGCNNFCSYCVVPYARGREISRPASEILKEIKKLIETGYKEIVLLGQNVNSYKSKIQISKSEINSKSKTKNSKPVNFSELLRRINSIPGNFQISFLSNHPKDFSDELIETMTKCRKVCEYVHLPLQAGDDKVLRNMNRKYTQKDYLKLVEKIRKAFEKYKPGKLYSITSDIIVGFPGETKKQLLKSAEVMEKVKYDMVYFGQFSRRPETRAFQMKDNVSKAEKARREKYLNEILKKTCFENNKKHLNKTLEVIIDKEKKGVYFGRTRTMKNVKLISAKKNLIGKIVKVKITKANIWNLEGIVS